MLIDEASASKCIAVFNCEKFQDKKNALNALEELDLRMPMNE